jgi:hypothetical protein
MKLGKMMCIFYWQDQGENSWLFDEFFIHQHAHPRSPLKCRLKEEDAPKKKCNFYNKMFIAQNKKDIYNTLVNGYSVAVIIIFFLAPLLMGWNKRLFVMMFFITIMLYFIACILGLNGPCQSVVFELTAFDRGGGLKKGSVIMFYVTHPSSHTPRWDKYSALVKLQIYS